MPAKSLCIFLFLSCLVHPTKPEPKLNQIDRLYKNLFANYTKKTRPALRPSDVTRVTVALYIVDLVKVDELEQTIQIVEWRSLSWNDYRLKWQPEDYAGVELMTVPVDELWIPDIILYNTITRSELWSGQISHRANLVSNGQIAVTFIEISTVRCNLNIELLPFDTQRCILRYESWAYSRQQLALDMSPRTSPEVDPQNKDPEWEVIEKTAMKNQTDYLGEESSNKTEPYDNILFHVTFKRNALYYIYSIIIPTFILTTIALIGTFCPFNPAGQREEKVNLGLTTLLAQAVMLQIVASSVPRSAHGLPLLGKFILSEFVFCSLATVTQVIIMYVNERAVAQEWDVPCWLLKLTCIRSKGFRKKASILPDSKTLREFSDMIRVKNETLDLVRNSVENIESILYNQYTVGDRQQLWNRVLDRIDMYFLIAFFTANCVITLYIFSPALV